MQSAEAAATNGESNSTLIGGVSRPGKTKCYGQEGFREGFPLAMRIKGRATERKEKYEYSKKYFDDNYDGGTVDPGSSIESRTG
jgi:hypothetical protein